MTLHVKTFVLLAAILITGLSAGFFYAWQVSVIPGTRRIADPAYLETMQSINRAILNPWFFLVFMGSPVLLGISTIQHYGSGYSFWLLLSATVIYAVGTFGVTAAGNVPLNDMLDALDLSTLGEQEMRSFRQKYEGRWNRLHLIRTVFAVVAFLLSLLPLFTTD